jgi:hypothetical protein
MVKSVELFQLRGLVLISHLYKPPAERDPKANQLALEARVRRIADAGAEQQQQRLWAQSSQRNRSSENQHLSLGPLSPTRRAALTGAH